MLKLKKEKITDPLSIFEAQVKAIEDTDLTLNSLGEMEAIWTKVTEFANDLHYRIRQRALHVTQKGVDEIERNRKAREQKELEEAKWKTTL